MGAPTRGCSTPGPGPEQELSRGLPQRVAHVLVSLRACRTRLAVAEVGRAPEPIGLDRNPIGTVSRRSCAWPTPTDSCSCRGHVRRFHPVHVGTPADHPRPAPLACRASRQRFQAAPRAALCDCLLHEKHVHCGTPTPLPGVRALTETELFHVKQGPDTRRVEHTSVRPGRGTSTHHS